MQQVVARNVPLICCFIIICVAFFTKKESSRLWKYYYAVHWKNQGPTPKLYIFRSLHYTSDLQSSKSIYVMIWMSKPAWKLDTDMFNFKISSLQKGLLKYVALAIGEQFRLIWCSVGASQWFIWPCEACRIMWNMWRGQTQNLSIQIQQLQSHEDIWNLFLNEASHSM